LSVGGEPQVPGLSCVTPIYRRDGSLQAVFSATFDLEALCLFLQSLHASRRGYAFVIEFRADGSRRVIAHPDAEILVRDVRQTGRRDIADLAPAEAIDDPHVAAFLDQLPAGFHPSDLGDERMVPITFAEGKERYLGSYRCLSTRETPDWLICVLIPESDVLERVKQHSRQTIFLGLCVLSLAIVISLLVSRRVARALEKIAGEAAAVGRLDVQPRPVVHSLVAEVDRVAVAIEDMKTGLRSFGKYVPVDLVRSFLTSSREADLGGEERIVTISFCDVANFTTISEGLTPPALVAQVSEYLGALSTAILQTGGTVDKYIGDAIMAFWGAPAVHPQHALAACTAALQNRSRLEELRHKWKAEGKPLFYCRTGIHTGPVIVGNIGSSVRLNYTIIGDAVNLASRLEGLNKLYGTDILISETTYAEAGHAVVARPIDWVSVKGKSEAVLVYELLGLYGEVPAESTDLVELYAQALVRYRSQDWPAAIALLEKVLAIRPEDSPARLMISRCQRYQSEPPGPAWDGVCRVTTK
jgi:adenylate cyclase